MTPPDGRGTALADFLQGASRPSAVALVVAAAVVASAAGFVAVRVTERAMTEDLAGYLADSPGDYDVFASAQAIRMRTGGTDRPLVVVLGSSSIREALDEGDVRAELAACGIADASVHNLATGRQPLADSLALADQIPDGARGVLLLGVGPSSFSDSPEEFVAAAESARLAVRSEAVDALLARAGRVAPHRSGNYLIDNRRFFVPRLGRLLERTVTRRTLRRKSHRYIGEPMLDGPGWSRQVEGVASRWRDHAEQFRWNEDVVTELVRRLRARTALDVLFVEHPVSARLVRESGGGEVLTRHRARVAETAARLGAGHLVLDEVARTTDAEFCDWAHLRDREAIARCGRAVARRAASVLSEAEARPRTR